MKINMAASAGRNESKITLEIRTKSVEQTLVPLVTQVRLWYLLIALHVSLLSCLMCNVQVVRVGGSKCRHFNDVTVFIHSRYLHNICSELSN